MIEDTNHSSKSILTREFDVHFTFAGFWIMCNTSWCDLVFLKVDRNPFFDTEVGQIIFDILMCFFLVKFPAFSIQIS